MWVFDGFTLALLLAGLMVVLWITEWIPVYLTALLPLLFAVPLGLLTPKDLAQCYGDSNIFLFFGGFVMALALEKWGVHEQIARRIIAVVGDKKSNILLGFILSTGLISMWISNTATALMMLPMAVAVVEAMPPAHRQSKFSVFLMLSIAYASNIGGVGTLIGSPPNTQMASILSESFNIEISFFDWMKIGMPLAILLLLLMFLIFNYLLGSERKDVHDLHFHTLPWSKAQKRVLWIFSIVAGLWIFREAIGIYLGINYRDENAAILGALAMFLMPSGQTAKEKVLRWSDTEKLPWGILLLFGGGLALAAVLEKNGVLEFLASTFESFHGIGLLTALAIMTSLAIFISEVLSNLAMVTLFIPVVGIFAQQTGLPLVPLAMALTLGASLAFMMPVGTPPNAIVFGSGFLRIKDMIRYGFVLNLISLALIILFVILFL
jgi:solute carrier family 13 (sodium-dependent dicarboxylate transporter), member 2/3/5